MLRLTVCFSAVVVAQDAPCKCSPPQSNTSFVDAQGTTHVTRVVPVPDDVSPEAQKALSQPRPDTQEPYDLAKDRAQAEGWQASGGGQMRKVYPVNIAKQTIAGVPTLSSRPSRFPPTSRTAC